MDSYHSYPKIYQLGHAYLSELLFDEVLVEEKLDGCVTPDTMILRSDLTYVPAGSLRVGDELVAFDDKVVSPKLKKAVVTAAAPIVKECWELQTDTRTVVASGDHPWLVAKPADYKKSTNSQKRWINMESLTPGDSIMALPVWSYDESRDAGELAGFYNGEGSLVRHGACGRILSVYQAVGPVADSVVEMLIDRGFRVSVDVRRRKAEWKEVASIVMRGGWTNILRFLGSIRPSRLIAQSDKAWVGAGMNYIDRETVISIRKVGDREVTGLSTSAGTYVAAGLLCHNSQFSWGKFKVPPFKPIASTDSSPLCPADLAMVDEHQDCPAEILRCRSKGAEIHVDAPEKMFVEAVRSVQNVFPLLMEGWTYRAEYLAKPKHNVLAYNRVPNGHLIIFDINTGNETYLSYQEKKAEAERLGFEVVPNLYQGKIESAELFRELLDRESVLGGQKIEGVVVKNYSRFGRDKKALMGKFVSEAFKEIHNADWKDRNPGQADILTRLVEKYKTPARWNKAIQHLREAGQLEDSPKDIGKLIQETEGDILKECEDEIKSDLWHWAWSHVRRGCTHGLPEWYKEILLKKQFENPPPDVRSPNLSGLAA